MLYFSSLDWVQVSPENHLMEPVIVHMLQHGLLLGGVDIDAFVLLIYLLAKFFFDLVYREFVLVEALLFFSDLVHI